MADNLNVNATVHSGASVSNWINQVNIGGTVYDIATHHGIKFHNGNTDEDGILWNGLTELDVVIPTLTDLVQDPIKFAGTVGENGEITYNTSGKKDPTVGDLVYITNDCTFNGVACEAGDMAIYTGTDGGWKVVSGENQVTIVGVGENNTAEVALTSTAKEVLTVEGKSLKLSVDFSALNSALSLSKNAAMELDVEDATVAVAASYITLKQGEAENVTIGADKSFNIPTALASGTVNINEKVLTATDFSWSEGSFPTIKMNDETKAQATTEANVIFANGGTSVVTSVDAAIKSAELVAATGTEGLEYVTSISAKAGATNYVTGISKIAADDTTTVASLIIKNVSVDNSAFVSGLSDAAATGEIVSAITVGAVTANTTGSDFVTGLDNEGTSGDVVTAVSFGEVSKNFATGFGTEGTTGDVVSSVSAIKTATLASDASSSFAGTAITAASVNDHVLSFGTSSFMKPVKIETTAADVKFKSLSTEKPVLTGTGVSYKSFTKGGITQVETTISYKSLLTGNVTLSETSDKYVFTTGKANDYSAITSRMKVSTSAATISTDTFTINASTDVTISANTFATGYDNAGTLPSWSANTATGSLTAAVASLALNEGDEVSFLEAASKTIAGVGTYTLEVSNTRSDDAIEVAVAGDYDVENGTVTIAANQLVTGVSIKA